MNSELLNFSLYGEYLMVYLKKMLEGDQACFHSTTANEVKE